MSLMVNVCPSCRALTFPSVPRCRSLSCSDRGQKELASPLHHPIPYWNGSGCKATVGSSVPTECSGAPDHLKQPRAPCPRPLPAGMPGHFPDARAASVGPLSPPLPSPAPSGYRSQPAIDQQTQRSGQTGRQPLPSPSSAVTPRNNGHGLTRPPSPRCHEVSSPELGLEEGMWKRASLPQRPPPPRAKWAHAVREDGLPEDASAPEPANPKHCKSQMSLASSCSTSDPDTPGRISLRISESALQTSPLPRGDYDDDVFMKDLRPKVTSSPSFETLPPPPPPPPSQETLANGSDDFPPPPPPATCEASPDSEADKEPGSRCVSSRSQGKPWAEGKRSSFIHRYSRPGSQGIALLLPGEPEDGDFFYTGSTHGAIHLFALKG